MRLEKRFILMVILALSMLWVSACSSTNAPEGSGGSGNGGDPGTSEGIVNEGSGEEEIQNRDVTVTRSYHASLEQFQNSDDINSNKIIEAIREGSGYNVRYETLPKDNASQRISVVLASGDVPDILWIPGKADYFRLAQQGAFEPLDDLIEKYMPNLERVFSKEELDTARYDGKLYGIPFRVAQKATDGLLLRWDMFEELGIEEPRTLEDLYNALLTIKGEKGITPLTGAAANPGGFGTSFRPIAGAFGVDTVTVVKDDKLEFSWIQPEYKQFLTVMKQWYDEGLIDQEFPVNTDRRDKMISGNAAVSVIPWGDAKTIDEALQERGQGGAVRYMMPPEGEDGQSGTPMRALANTFQVIPVQAENKEGAAEYFNYIFSEEGDILTTFGLEGEDYTVEGGEIVQTEEQSDAIPWRTLYFLSDTDPSFNARLDAKGFLPYYEPLLEFKQNREETNYAPSIEDWDSRLTDLRNFAEENAIQFVLNRRDLSEFDQFVEEFNARGGTVAIDAMNEWFTNQ